MVTESYLQHDKDLNGQNSCNQNLLPPTLRLSMLFGKPCFKCCIGVLMEKWGVSLDCEQQMKILVKKFA